MPCLRPQILRRLRRGFGFVQGAGSGEFLQIFNVACSFVFRFAAQNLKLERLYASQLLFRDEKRKLIEGQLWVSLRNRQLGGVQ